MRGINPEKMIFSKAPGSKLEKKADIDIGMLHSMDKSGVADDLTT